MDHALLRVDDIDPLARSAIDRFTVRSNHLAIAEFPITFPFFEQGRQKFFNSQLSNRMTISSHCKNTIGCEIDREQSKQTSFMSFEHSVVTFGGVKNFSSSLRFWLKELKIDIDASTGFVRLQRVVTQLDEDRVARSQRLADTFRR